MPSWKRLQRHRRRRPATTVRQALENGIAKLRVKGLPNPALDCSLLLAAAMGTNRYKVLSDPYRAVPAEALSLYSSYLHRRERLEPMQYILGVQEFMGLPLAVRTGVFIPRPETELLVETLLDELRRRPERAPLLLDPCTGSGNIAISVAKFVPDCHVLATDISAEALAVATSNAFAHGVSERIRFVMGHLLEPAIAEGLEGKATAVVCNPPYIPIGRMRDLPPEVKEYEPYMALCGGQDGLDYYPPLTSQAAVLLKADGLLAFEVDCDGARAVADIIQRQGCFYDIRVLRDLAGLDRVVVARRIPR